MKKSILIIESKINSKISESFIRACTNKPLGETEIFVAKTQQAADKILEAHPDISAIITEDEDGPKVNILDGSEDYSSDSQESELPVRARVLPRIDDEEKTKCEYVPTDSGDADESDESDSIDRSESFYRRPIRRKKAPVSHSGSLEDILDILEKYDLLKSSEKTCPHHDKHTQSLYEARFHIDSLNKTISDIQEKISELKAEVNNCPLKKNLIKKALDKPDSDEPAKSRVGIIVALIGLIGALITAGLTFAGKIMEIVLPYISSGTP
jgi:preprotein translocase subunit Sss1